MNGSMDDIVRRSLRSKFDQFEAPVKEDLWNGVVGQINDSAGKTYSKWRRALWALLLLVLATSTVGYYLIVDSNVNSESVDLQPKSIENRPSNSPKENTRKQVTDTEDIATDSNSNPEDSNESIDQKTLVNDSAETTLQEKSRVETTQDSESVSIVKKPESERSGQGLEETVDSKAPQKEAGIVGREKFDLDKIQELKGRTVLSTTSDFSDNERSREGNLSSSDELSSSDPELDVSLSGAAKEITKVAVPDLLSLKSVYPKRLLFPDADLQPGTVFSFKRTRFLMRLNFGIMMNYVIVRPNLNDNFLFEEDSPELDLSSDHLGLRIGYDMWFHMSSRFWFKSQIFMNARQHNISLNYANNPSQGSEPNFEMLTTKANLISLGLSAGMIYQIDNDDVKKRAIDIGLTYEQNVLNEFKDTQLLNYPNGYWSAQVGFTFSPKRGRKFLWLIRPFAYYGLNKQTGSKAGTLTPFGFGVQFIRHR